jgi:hypothetical protein
MEHQGILPQTLTMTDILRRLSRDQWYGRETVNTIRQELQLKPGIK